MSRIPRSDVTVLRDHVCGKVKRLLDSYLAGELSVETNHEILEHLESCPACRAELEAREKLRASVRRIEGAEAESEAGEPRAGLFDEMRGRIARTPLPRPLVAPASLLIAAGILLAAALALVSRRPPSPVAGGPGPAAADVDSRAFQVAALNHLECALKGEWPRGEPSLDEISAKLDPSLAPAFRAVAPRLDGYAAVAAHECEHDGRRGFHVIFRKKGTTDGAGLVSFLAIRKTSGSLPTGRERVPVDRWMLQEAREKGLDVAASETSDRMVFLISDRGPETNLAMARAVLPAAATAFAVGR